ncbi:MAG: hypothetical protein ACI8UD_003091 [Planctomycetota bacterium]|jgi:hypothetical protein
MLVRLAAVMALCLAATQNPNASLKTFKNYNRTFQLELPDGWRQIAPTEADTLSEEIEAPPDIRPTQPRVIYTVGPIDKWLDGKFDGPWLRMIEKKNAMYIGDDYQQLVRDTWRRQAEITGVTHQIGDIRIEKLGTQQVECVVVVRTSTPPKPRAVTKSLDVHAPTANQHLIFSFGCPDHQFDRWQPEFRRWLDTLTFARAPEPAETLSDRLWTPLLVGGAVGLVLLLLYKHTRAGR